jgi:hypothetical protein
MTLGQYIAALVSSLQQFDRMPTVAYATWLASARPASNSTPCFHPEWGRPK